MSAFIDREETGMKILAPIEQNPLMLWSVRVHVTAVRHQADMEHCISILAVRTGAENGISIVRNSSIDDVRNLRTSGM